MPVLRNILTPLAAAVFFIFGTIPVATQGRQVSSVEEYRNSRNSMLRADPFSPLMLMRRVHLEGQTELLIGNSYELSVWLPGKDVALLHATLIVQGDTVRVRAAGNARLARVGEAQANRIELDLTKEPGFRIGRFNLLFRRDAPVRGAALEVYDTEEPALREFRGLEFFEIAGRYRVQSELTPRAEPPQVQLIDSAGQPRPYFIYGDLRFTLDGTPVTMEVYSTTLDRAAIARTGFMLIFADATSGKESYYAGRYLDIEGKLSGTVTVDFNLARNPPCAFSPVFTCPFPRAQNRLPVAIRAGEKAYRGKTATPLKK